MVLAVVSNIYLLPERAWYLSLLVFTWFAVCLGKVQQEIVAVTFVQLGLQGMS